MPRTSLAAIRPATSQRRGTGRSVLLYCVGGTGSLMPVPGFDPSNPPTADVLSNTFQATIPLSEPLCPGRYRIVLVGQTDVSNFMSNSLWDPGEDQPLADFTVLP